MKLVYGCLAFVSHTITIDSQNLISNLFNMTVVFFTLVTHMKHNKMVLFWDF